MKSSEMLDFNKLISSKRLSTLNCGYVLEIEKADEKYNKIRTPFQRDYDRIIFSQAFRRLGGKTQVHPLSDNDSIHTRLTHSLETASVGRSLGLMVGDYLKKEQLIDDKIEVNDIATILQSACLAHDLGNPPFGHAGEYAIANWFKEFFNKNKGFPLDDEFKKEFEVFDGNAQGFRLVNKLENNFLKGGMNLTITTLSTMIKYPHFAKQNQENKFSIFMTEEKESDLIFNELGLKYVRSDSAEQNYLRHPLSYLMEAADDICYVLLDLVDAIELELIEFEDVLPFYKEAIKDDVKVNKVVSDSNLKFTRKASRLTAYAINELTLCLGNIFINNIKRFTNRSEIIKISSLIDLDADIKKLIKDIKVFSKENIFSEKNKSRLEIAAYKILGDLLEVFVNAAVELNENAEENLTYKNKNILDLMGKYKPQKSASLYEKLRLVVDFISGMTDRYATMLFQQLNGMSFQFKRL
jgi:dGTPase